MGAPRLLLLAALLLRPAAALLQIHNRLAAAILNKARLDAVEQREALLAEAERLLQAASEIDEALERLAAGAAPSPPPPVSPAPPPPPAAATNLDGVRKLGESRLRRIVDFTGESAELAPLALDDALGLETLYLLAWRAGDASAATGVRVADGDDGCVVLGDGDECLNALTVTAGDGDVLVSLTCETHARQVAHVMTSLDGFPMKALEFAVSDVADVVLANDAVCLGVIVSAEGEE